MIDQSTVLEVCMVHSINSYSTNIQLNNETKDVLESIEKSKNWTLENGKYGNRQVKAIGLGASWALGLGAGLATNYFYNFSQFDPFFSGVTFSGIFMAGILVSEAEKRHVTQLSKRLTQLTIKYKQDANPLAEKLETIVKTAKNYIESRSLSERCLAATLLAAGLAASYLNYLPEGIQPMVLASGLVGTTALELYHCMYKRQDLKQVTENINECLKLLKK